MADTKTSALSTITGINTAAGDKYLVLDVSDTTQGAGGTLKAMTRTELAAAMGEEGLGGGGGSSFAILQDVKAASTDGGTFTSGAWQTRTLNTELSDIDSIVTLSANVFTPISGTYLIEANATAMEVLGHSLRLYNVTDSVDVGLVGTSEYADVTGSVCNKAYLTGVFTTDGTKGFRLEHQCSTTRGTFGFGVSVTWASNIYAEVKLTKIA